MKKILMVFALFGAFQLTFSQHQATSGNHFQHGLGGTRTRMNTRNKCQLQVGGIGRTLGHKLSQAIGGNDIKAYPGHQHDAAFLGFQVVAAFSVFQTPS